MFAKLAFKNIKRSIKDYAVYFFTLVLAVAIFYVFNSLESQSVMLDVTERVRSMLDLLNVILGIVSVFVSFILGALIIYASRFLIKRRGKEFGIYLTLGMSKRKISLILLLETLLIGLFSLAVGLVLGVLASQLMSVLVANMFDANLTEFHFVFSMSAFLKTLLYFGIIYVIVMLFNTINVSRQKLINLLSSSKRNEKIKNKNLWVCTVVFIIAAVFLGIAYYLVTDGLTTLMQDADGPNALLIPIIMGIVATFMLFWSLSGIMLRIAMSFKRVYYNKLNSFILRQFSSKINTTVVSMGLICLMLFVTICILGSALSINKTLHARIEASLPVDVEVTSVGRNAWSIREAYERENVVLEDFLKDIVVYNNYLLSNYEVTTDGEVIMNESVAESPTNETYIMNEFVNLSDYNRAAKVFNLPELELNNNEYVILANYPQAVEVYNKNLAAGKTIVVAGTKLSSKYDHCIEGSIELEMTNLNDGIFIVPDTINFGKIEEAYKREHLVANYKDANKTDSNDFDTDVKINSLNNRFFREDSEDDLGEIYYYNVETKQAVIDNNVGTSALVTFVGLYLGIIFLISSAAILALKELSESSDNRDKYTILRKIGASNGMLNRALFWQIFIFFLFPLVIAILHAVFGLKFCAFLLSTLGGFDILGSIPWVALILLGIYGGYFLITYFCSRNIIREHRN